MEKSTVNPLLIFLFLVILFVVVHRNLRPKQLPLPPGPPGLPIIGNLLQAPKSYPWLQFDKWKKQYGPIFSLKVGADVIIVLGNYEIAHELLDKRGTTYSSRPHKAMAGDCATKGLHLLLRPYDSAYRLHKRLGATVLNAAASRSYAPVIDLESCQLLTELMVCNDFTSLLRRFTISTAFSLSYGLPIKQGAEEFQITSRVVNNFFYTMATGAWIVDLLPFLNRLPQMFAPWKRIADGIFKFDTAFYVRNMEKGLESNSWNFAKQLAGSKEARDMDRVELAWELGIISIAAMETTSCSLNMFIMAAIKHPEIMNIAQKELDNVVGRRRLPTIEDRDNLPYLNALINELLRWRPIIPAGIPHVNLEEDTYMGYRIPKGAIVFGSHWSIGLDEHDFGDPDIFRPERWIENPDLPNIAFGFGRRICTGRHIAMMSLFYVISRLLWTFNIRAGLDDSGREIELDDMAMTDHFASGPLPFKARFELRDLDVKGIVEKEWQEREKGIGVVLESIKSQRHK